MQKDCTTETIHSCTSRQIISPIARYTSFVPKCCTSRNNFKLLNVHQKIEWDRIPTGPRSVSCDRAIGYSGFFFGVRETWVRPWVRFLGQCHKPRKSKPTKLCPLVGSGILNTWIILKTSHFVWSWTSRVNPIVFRSSRNVLRDRSSGSAVVRFDNFHQGTTPL